MNKIWSTTDMVKAFAIAIMITIISGCTVSEPADSVGDFDGTELSRFSSEDEINSFLSGDSESETGSTTQDDFQRTSENSLQYEEADGGAVSGDQDNSDSSDYSKTNAQIEGIDEADIVKTNGELIFVVASGDLYVVDTDSMDVIHEMKDDEKRIREIILHDDKLALLGSEMTGEIGHPRPEPLPMPIGRIGIMPYPYSQRTFVDIYEFSSASGDLELDDLESISLLGNLKTSRLKDGKLLTIVGNPLGNSFTSPVIEYDGGEEEIEASDVYHSDVVEEDYELSIIFDIDMTSGDFDTLPLLKGYSNDIFISENNIYLSGSNSVPYTHEHRRIIDEVYTKVLPSDVVDDIRRVDGYDIRENTRLNEINFIVHNYITSLNREDMEDVMESIEELSEPIREEIAEMRDKTVVHRISIDDLEYRSSGLIDGHTHGRFSFDESDDRLYVVTTSGSYWRSDSTSKTHLHVLDSGMNEISSLRNIAEDKRVDSVRFTNATAYISFSDSDESIKVIDLAEPRVLGDMDLSEKVNYMQPIGDDLMISLGEHLYETEQGYNLDDGLKISLFDVRDPTAPEELSSIRVGGRGTRTDSVHDPRSLLYDSETGLLVLPISEREKTEPETEEILDERDVQGEHVREWLPFGDYVFQGAYIFSVGRDEGIEELHRITHISEDEEEDNIQRFYSENNIVRSLFIGENLFTVSGTTVKSHHIDGFEETGSIVFRDIDNDTKSGDSIAGRASEEVAVDDPVEPDRDDE